MLEPVSVGLKFGFLAVLYVFLLWVAWSALRGMRRGPAASGRGRERIDDSEAPPIDATGMYSAADGLGGVDDEFEPRLLVDKPLVPDAVALNSAQFNASRMVGSALGGIAVATIGVTSTLIINAATFSLPILALFAMRGRELLRPRKPRTNVDRSSCAKESRYVLRTPPILAVIGLLAVIGTLGFNWQVVAPLLARIVLHRRAVGFGLLLSAMAAGSLVGSAALTCA
ncbi:MAG: MFS transporter, partial [Solirubrobacteraceae bacterium]